MLCYRCGSHVPDGSTSCPTCGQTFASGGLRQTTGTFSRRKLSTSAIDGAPYRPGDVVAGRFTIRDIVGQGPVGFVFRAYDKEIDVEVALKSVSPKLLQTLDERRHFAREFKGAKKLNHNNIARIYDEGEHDDRPYFTSQFLDGLSLRKIIDLRKEKGAFFTLDEIEPILAQIATALDEAHRAGVVHGDIKPENVLVLPDLLKVTDFALGMAMPRLPFVNAQKARKADRYCAPEFVQGGEVSSAVDVYALGAIMGEMLAGVLPEGNEIPDLRRANPGVTGQVEALYRRAVNANPEARFARAGALAAEIALIAPGEDVGSETVPMSRQAVATAIARSNAGQRPPTDPGRAARPGTDPGRRQSTAVGRKPPPPPAALAAQTMEVELTPAAGRPPPPPVPGISTREIQAIPEPSRPHLAPPIDPQEALPTKSIELPSVLDGNGRATEEPTQVLASGPFEAPTQARLPAVMPIARPLPPQRKLNLAIPLLMVVGLFAGVGGGWLYLQHDRAEAEKQAAELRKQEEERRRVADAEDAGHWAALLAAGDPRDAGPDVALANLPADAGSKVVAAGTNGTTGGEVKHAVATLPKGGAGCPDGMAFIPAGDFMKGYKSGDQLAGWDEQPLGKAKTDAYCIDLYEYPDQAGGKPTTSVSFSEAKSACENQGKRLCSEDEWERACKGPSSSRFSYGDSYDAQACNMGKAADGAGSHERCKSGFGVFDLSGNVAEWTSSRYTAGVGGKAIKGGPGDSYARCAGRRPGSEKLRENMLGFRCCRDAG